MAEERAMTPQVAQLKELASMLNLEYREHLQSVAPPRELVHGEFSRILGSWGKQFKMVPFLEEGGAIQVATSDPLNIHAIDTLRFCYGKPINLVVTSEEEITRAINSVRTSLMSDRESGLDTENTEGSDEISNTLKIDVTDAEDDDAPIIRYVNTLIFRAASQRASDIHIEPFEDELKVRFRIDGVLHDIDTEDKAFQAAILSRVKVMANLNIAEKRLPQDGRIGIRIAGQDVDIRVSTVPTRYGERIVMRLLDTSQIKLDLELLGLSPTHKAWLQKIITKTYGIILVTGPTGSGKTTTLYTCLSGINSEDKNILTVEDPIEYELKGVGQMQVNPKIDFTFASGLRSILRQDPDVIMVGEIRDLETVEIAIQASLTGHLVFSTLHTNDAPGAITRLLDMGVEPFLISSSLIAILAQRLIRTLCPQCKVPYKLNAEQCKELNLNPANTASLQVYAQNPVGCEVCGLSGYKGRTGIHELLVLDDAVRSKVMQRANSSEIRSSVKNLTTLRIDGTQKLLAGITSFEEIIRVTQDDFVD